MEFLDTSIFNTLACYPNTLKDLAFKRMDSESYLCNVTMIMNTTLEHFPVNPYQNKLLHIQSDLAMRKIQFFSFTQLAKCPVVKKLHPVEFDLGMSSFSVEGFTTTG